MAVNGELGADENKSSDASNDLPIFNAENLQTNMKVIYYRFVLTG